MLMTVMKSEEEILTLATGKIFVINCFGCKEVNVPEAEHQAERFITDLKKSGRLTGMVSFDYICNPEYWADRMVKYAAEIEAADTVLVFSCGVGVQTVASLLPGKRVLPGCDTYPLPGFQGVTPLEYDCKQCGQCYLNITGGICPITACSKSLVNGQCGGEKNGKCEVDPNMDCGWEKIYRRLAQLGRLDAMKAPIQLRDYNK